MGFQDLEKAIFRAVFLADEEQLQQCVYEIEMAQVDSRSFLEENFNLLLRVMERSEFWEMQEGSIHLFSILNLDFEKLSSDQQDRLLVALEKCYPHFSDATACLTIVELIGENFSNETGLAVLARLAALEQEVPRSFVSHGLERIVISSRRDALAEKAFAQLLKMKADDSKAVRAELAVSMNRIILKKRASDVGKKALEALVQMKEDQSEEVKKEVLRYIQSLTKKGVVRPQTKSK